MEEKGYKFQREEKVTGGESTLSKLDLTVKRFF